MKGNTEMTKTSTLRRGAGIALGSATLALALAACGSGGSVKTADPTTEAATTSAAAPAESSSAAPAATTSAAAPAESSSAAAPAGDLSETDITAAKQRFLDFVTAAVNKDGKGACSIMLDPTASEPTPIAPGPVLDGCAQGIEGEADSIGMTPDQVASLTPDMLEGTAQPDGSVKISAGGQEFPFPMVRAGDGNWYINANGSV